MRSDIMWDRWDEVDEIFARALERPYEQRHEFIVQASGDDAALLETLTALVAASERAETDFAGPADALLREVFGNAPAGGVVPERTPGELLGRYRLIRELGRGGMATVFEAERADGLYEQRVAIKLLRHGIEGNELAQRLQLETRILSNLAHPGIAQLLDAGTTEDKQPFFVMELVEGEPITSWADRQRLDIDSRLDLFVQVADAVGFAHKRLVVHRDIKPSNVLVTNDGRVKLLDFGIAKLLEPESVGAAEADQTTRWMTPVYAAPEQFLGRPVTTATDVYGLGGLLYELLAGKRPFEDRTGSDYSLASAVCESVPDAPSAVVAGSPGSAASRGTQPERLRRLLAGDLDAIVSKALRKEPEDRYPSAEALAEDVRRHRTGFPVAARAGLRSYRLRKFLERHWWSVGAAAAIILTLAVSSLVLWRQQIQTAEARDNAAQAAAVATMEAENARLVIDFLADVFRGRDPMQAPSDTLTARELLAWGSERVDQEFSDRPALQAELFSVLGSAYSNLGLLDESVEHIARSIDLARTVHGDTSAEVARKLNHLSGVHRANRDPVAALPAAQEALDIRLAMLGVNSVEVGSAMTEIGYVRALMNQPDSAESILRNALDILRFQAGEEDSTYVEAVVALAMVRRMQNQFDDAAALYEQALPHLRTQGNAALVVPLNNYAFLLRTLNEYERAEPIYRESLEISQELYGRGHPSTLNVANNLASVLNELGRTTQVLTVLRESAAAAEAQWPDGHWRVGAAHAALGRALLRYRLWDDAFEELRLAHASYSQTIGAAHLWTYYIEAAAAAGHVAQGRSEIGQPYLDEFYRQRRDHPPEPNNTVALNAFVNDMTPFLNVLDDLGLEEEARRFRALLPAPSSDDGPAT